MTSAPIRPKPPAVCNRNRDTAAPSRTYRLESLSGGVQPIYDHLAREHHLNLYGQPEAVPLAAVGRVKPEEFERIMALNKAAVEALDGLWSAVRARRSVRR